MVCRLKPIQTSTKNSSKLPTNGKENSSFCAVGFSFAKILLNKINEPVLSYFCVRRRACMARCGVILRSVFTSKTIPTAQAAED